MKASKQARIDDETHQVPRLISCFMWKSRAKNSLRLWLDMFWNGPTSEGDTSYVTVLTLL